jgi:hypothetical protein
LRSVGLEGGGRGGGGLGYSVVGVVGEAYFAVVCGLWVIVRFVVQLMMWKCQ